MVKKDDWIHILITLNGCSKSALRDKKAMGELVHLLIARSDLRKLGDMVFRELPETKDNIAKGIDGITVM
jgi:hypothetical protein